MSGIFLLKYKYLGTVAPHKSHTEKKFPPIVQNFDILKHQSWNENYNSTCVRIPQVTHFLYLFQLYAKSDKQYFELKHMFYIYISLLCVYMQWMLSAFDLKLSTSRLIRIFIIENLKHKKNSSLLYYFKQYMWYRQRNLSLFYSV